MAASMMEETSWDDPPSLLDASELSTSALDMSSQPASHVDEDDGEMELSSVLPLSSDSDSDTTPLFPKTSASQSPELSHLTERQQLAYLMRTTQQQRRTAATSSAHKQQQQQPQQQQQKRNASPPPPAPLPHNNKPKAHNSTSAAKPLTTKPSLLTHDKKRRRTTTTTAATTSIDPDDSHLYTVQRLPPASTAPHPLPLPAHYSTWSAQQKRRWDRVSDQPGLYYYHHTAPGVDARVGEWSEQEVEWLLHLLVCHPINAGGSSGSGDASEWGLFSINVPGRVGSECERKYKELAAAGRLVAEDTFDYMRWYERQKQRSVEQAKPQQGRATSGEVKMETSADSARAETKEAAVPAVINRKRVGAPSPQSPVNDVKSETPASQPAAVKVEAATAKQESTAAKTEQPQRKVSQEVRAEPVDSAERKEPVKPRSQRREREKEKVEVREQPPRKKVVRFEQPPASVVADNSADTVLRTETDSAEPAVDTPTSDAPPVARPPAIVSVNRRPPPSRVAIPASAPAVASRADEQTESALWPPRPPRMPIAASAVPSSINSQPNAANVTKRLDTSQLKVSKRALMHCVDTSHHRMPDAHITPTVCLLPVYGFNSQPVEVHLLHAQATYEVRKARLESFLQAELARIQSNVVPVVNHSSIGRFIANAARLSKQYFWRSSTTVDEAVAVEPHKLVKALHMRVAVMQADVEREYRLQCEMLNAVHATEK